MKKLLFIVSLAFFAASCESKGSSENDVELGKSYGPVKVDTSKSVSVDEMLKTFEGQKAEMEFTFFAPISEVCSKAGCWINVDKGNGETFMVRFKDHFTIPPKTKVGTEAYLHGVAHWDTVSVELLQHFAEDAGKSKEEIAKITEPKFELGFEADGIVLKK
ncbi:MAG: hypothetical protein RI883_1353 [Bacteroidota bacterium]|jgi:hypothetical protein